MKLNEDEQKWLDDFNAKEKRQTSYTGGILFKEPTNPEPRNFRLVFDDNKLIEIAGEWLVVLYHNNSNIELTAAQLGMKVNTLRKRLYKLREDLLDQGYNYYNLGKRLRKN